MKACVITVLFFLCYTASGQQFRLQKILTNYNVNGSAQNETHFYYPGNRGSDYKNGIINYDSATAFYYGRPSVRYTRTYDTADRILTDNSTVVSNPPYYNVSNSTYTYDSIGRLVKASYYNGEHRHDPYYSSSVYLYDSNNLLSEINTNGSGSVHLPPYPPRKTIYSYDSAKNVISILQQYMDTIQQVYINIRKDSFVYDGGNVLIEKWLEDWQNSAWQTKYKYEYTYSPPLTKPVEILLSYYDTGTTPFSITKQLITYNSLNDTVAIIVQSYKQSVFVNFSKVEYSYNIYNQPDKIIDSRWDTTSSSWDAPHTRRQHIYEVYWPTSIPEKIAETGSIKVYPNPAINNISITLPQMTKYAVRATIYDMQGKVVKDISELPGHNINYTVDISDQVQGNYIIKLSGKDIRASIPFSIIR